MRGKKQDYIQDIPIFGSTRLRVVYYYIPLLFPFFSPPSVFHICRIWCHAYTSFMSFLSVLIFQAAVDADDIPMVELNVAEYSTTPTVRIVI